MASLQVKTQLYSGPFDLLLHLVQQQKLAIGAFSIADIAEQYLKELEKMEEIDLDVASDFILVASQLLDIKAHSLLPEDMKAELKRIREAGKPHDETDDENERLFEEDELLNLIDPNQTRDILIARLLTYRQYRAAAASLAARSETEARMFARTSGPGLEFAHIMPDYIQGISLRTLAVLLVDLLQEKQSVLIESEHIAPVRVPIVYAMSAIDRLVRLKTRMTFRELLGTQQDRQSVVTHFLALLELYKRGYVDLSQEQLFGEIMLQPHADSNAFVMQNDDEEVDMS